MIATILEYDITYRHVYSSWYSYEFVVFRLSRALTIPLRVSIYGIQQRAPMKKHNRNGSDIFSCASYARMHEILSVCPFLSSIRKNCVFDSHGTEWNERKIRNRKKCIIWYHGLRIVWEWACVRAHISSLFVCDLPMFTLLPVFLEWHQIN